MGVWTGLPPDRGHDALAWIPSGTRGVITGWLRPHDQWLADLPTYDVEMAWREPVWALEDPRWPRGEPSGQCSTPEEFLELYAVLPTSTGLLFQYKAGGPGPSR